jgi:haloacetate dehalogenase
VWRDWVEDLTAAQVPGGHFNPEEASEEVLDLLAEFLETS